MSLRARLSVLITVLFLFVSVLGIGLVIINARHAVQQELESTANLAVQLLGEIAQNSGSGSDPQRWDWFERVNELENVRHLCISVLNELGIPAAYSGGCGPTKEPKAPGWFVNLLAAKSVRFSRPLITPANTRTAIIVHADPADEIDEAWKEARVLIGLILLFAVIANAVVFFVLGAAVRPLTAVQNALDRIERGDYRMRLPEFRLPEISVLADHVNSMAQALEKRTQEVHVLAQKSLDIQEDERRALARELHDELGQSVSAIKADAASIKQRNGSKDRRIDESADAISDVCSRIYSVVKNMMSRLRPGTLDELGLTSALTDYVEEWGQRHQHVEVNLCVEEYPAYDRDPLNIHIYRIVQEALTNVTKHARAHNVTIDLRVRNGRIELVVGDDGCGFEAGAPRNGLGLLGIRERVESLGGQLSLETRPGWGTVLRATIPVS